ncbi:MAG: Coenzyme F420 hydrogenase/dehydrogenase, beta subunit C-terminal domain [Bacilli bacterium]|nr:Coenzyme F420 hydrogenase/dehydrogenase, beta subunit C-terminal domain [Bacilli bacterium]
MCRKKCPVLNAKENDSINKCYVAYNRDKNECLNASSGSIFSLVANYILENNGIVVGAAFDENNKLKHIAVEKKEDLEPLRKSKYLQSDLENIFSFIKNKIKDRKVLFVGTPCQVAGIKAFITNNDNLFVIDIFCHGVPSPKLFNKYIRELEMKHDDEVLNYDFRDNTTGWDTYSNKISFKNKEIKQSASKNEYMQLFLSDIALRESCYNCNFKLGNKYSDITLGDFWGIKNYYPDMYNYEGVSAIIINTPNGEKIFNNIKKDLIYKDCELNKIICGNPSLIKSSKRPKNRDSFFDDINNYTIENLLKKYKRKNSLAKKIYNKLKKITFN